MSEMNGSSSSVAPAAQAIVSRMMAAHSDVHSYALEELTAIENKIVRVKAAIVEQKNRSQQETQIYIETIDQALRAAAVLDAAVDGIARAVEPPRGATPIP
jgi:hypothetical protein